MISLCQELPTFLEKRGETPQYGRREKFPALKEQGIKQLVELLSTMGKEIELDPKKVLENYQQFLTQAGNLRRAIAYETETPDANQFGLRRLPTHFPTDFKETHLYAKEHSETNAKIKEMILKNIKMIKNREKGVCLTKTKDKISKYTFYLVYSNDIFAKSVVNFQKQSKITLAYDGYQRMRDFGYASIAADEYTTKQKGLLSIIQKTAIEPSRDDLFSFDENSFLYYGKIEIKVDGAWRVLTRHYSTLPCDNQKNIEEKEIALFKANGFVSLLHTDSQDLPLHQNLMAELFNKIMSKQSSGSELKQLIGEFEYRLHHMYYFERGSAAISEMMIEAIKRSFCEEYRPKGHLAALAEPSIVAYIST